MDTFIADTFFDHGVNIWGKIYYLIADNLWLVGKIENIYMFLFDTFLCLNMRLVKISFQPRLHQRDDY